MIWSWLTAHAREVVGLLGQQVLLAVVPTVVGLVLGVPLGYLVSRRRTVSRVVLALVGLVAAIPAIALFVGMPVLLGTRLLDPVNVAVALAVYSLARLLRSVVVGVRSVPAPITQSASALGYGPVRRFVEVELPVALPAVLTALRVVLVANLVLVTVAGMIGRGGLGQLFGPAPALVAPLVVGIVLTLVVALLADGLIRLIERGTTDWRRWGIA